VVWRFESPADWAALMSRDKPEQNLLGFADELRCSAFYRPGNSFASVDCIEKTTTWANKFISGLPMIASRGTTPSQA